MDRNIPSLTGFRGLLAFWVLLYHVSAAGTMMNVPLGEHFSSAFLHFLDLGALGVDGFFLLSGFVLSYVYGQSLGTGFSFAASKKFILLRLARIYPVHAFIILSYAALKLAGIVFPVEYCGVPTETPDIVNDISCHRFGLYEMLRHLTLLSAWWGGWGSLSWNPLDWSVSAEWMAYLSFPLLILLVRHIRHGLLALMLAIASLGAQYLWMQHEGYSLPNIPIGAFGAQRIYFEFIAGMLMHQFYRSPLYAKMPWHAIAYLVIGGFIAAYVLESHPFVTALLFVPLILVLAQPSGFVSQLLSTRLAVWLGHISFSLYMCHVFVMEVLGVITVGSAPEPQEASPISWLEGLGMLGGIMVASIAFAAFLYHGVEEPSRRWLRKHIGASANHN